MLRSSIPLRFTVPFANSAAGAFIRTVPVASQIGIDDGAASFTDGFVPDNFTPVDAGGVPPFGQDFNGLNNIMTTWDIWYQAGGPIAYDVTFSTAQSGYPAGAKLDSAIVLGAQWYSLVDGNTTNPDDPLTSANWARVGIPAGVPLQFLGSTAPFAIDAGYVPMNALTLGNAASNAGYANANALFLFVSNWLNFSNTQCPILTSAGVPTTRGANAVADFNANRQLTLPNGKGLSLIGADTMGGTSSTFLAGAPVTIGNTTTPGSIIGETTHALSGSENGAHTHTTTITDTGHVHATTTGQNQNIGSGGYSGTGNLANVNIGANTGNSVTGIGVAVNSSGSGTGHNTVQRSMIVFWGQKL